MKTKKLELKDIVGYLPYGILFQEQRDHTILRMDSIESRNCYEIWATQKYIRGFGKDADDINYPYLSAKNCSGQGFKLKQIKPILHPMSDLVTFLLYYIFFPYYSPLLFSTINLSALIISSILVEYYRSLPS